MLRADLARAAADNYIASAGLRCTIRAVWRESAAEAMGETLMERQGSSFFVAGDLASDLAADLWRLNPWWENAPMRRRLVAQTRKRLDAEIAPIAA